MYNYICFNIYKRQLVLYNSFMWSWQLVLQVFLIGVSLAMDAFAVSICDGMCYSDLNKKKGGTIALHFGAFQMAMPLVGFFIAFALSQAIDTSIIDRFDHWVAFILLLFIGGKMIVDAVLEMRKPGEQLTPKKFNIAEVLVQGIATSIDALAVGVSFIAMYSEGITEVTIWGYTGIIGATTVLIVAGGVLIGSRVGKLFERKTGIAQILGGIVLLAIGLKILIEGLI